LEWPSGEAARCSFDAFVAGSTAALYRLGYFTVGDAAEAEDLVQETFVRVAARWGRVHSPERRLAYARRVLFNLALDDARRRARRREELGPRERVVEQWPDDSAARTLGGVDDAAELTWALRALSRQQRAVLVLRYWQDLSEAETADVLGCSIGTVKKTTWRAVARLRGNLAPHALAPGAATVRQQRAEKAESGASR
jgi:RNA polymerase sigma-70 factor (sigma-E family)